ncbi:site-specific integrase [Pseudonocardia kujensis]|uniref:tyrosine-type recombinase/integrase n=1 Tax=Pseudonocardia kujensis TaxID=1128675 RepID=UPI001E63952B|nr:tyrosine-type recombinase/integrase [Pseudonocardia kujensis]MCE0765389.1 site-specific integrase [Pseudonocardia kujensis]
MPNDKGRRRRFGSIRKTPIGEYQASYLGPDNRRHFAPHRFKRERDADRWLNKVESVIVAGDWTNPERGKVALADYAEQWIIQRPALRPRTVELYQWLLRRYITPEIGTVPLAGLTSATVRQWRSDLLTKRGVSETSAAKAYRLLRAVLNTAVEEDKLITANPCRIRGADRENRDERPVLTVAQVFQIADAMPNRRWRAMILLAAFASLRWGETSALRRQDVAPDGSTVRIAFAHSEVRGKGLVVGPPKSRAGVRTVAVPAAIRKDLVDHLAEFVDAGPDALLFTGVQGRALHRGAWGQRVKWPALMRKLGLAGVHFHDLRHAGNIWASKAGMSTKDLMARMGHDDMRAALIYQRATSDADRLIADRLSALVDEHRGAS